MAVNTYEFLQSLGFKTRIDPLYEFSHAWIENTTVGVVLMFVHCNPDIPSKCRLLRVGVRSLGGPVGKSSKYLIRSSLLYWRLLLDDYAVGAIPAAAMEFMDGGDI